MIESFALFGLQGLGIAGFLVFAVADTLQSLRRIANNGLVYLGLCAIAAILVGANLVWDFDLGILLAGILVLTTYMVCLGAWIRHRDRRKPHAGAQTIRRVRFP